MSIEQANAFRTFVNENETVQDKIREGLVKDESFSLVEVAAEHGYAFTSEEAQTAWDEAQTDELSDFELEVVSGGAMCGGRDCRGNSIGKDCLSRGYSWSRSISCF